MKKLYLKQNMRAFLDPSFSDFLLKIGENSEPIDDGGNVTLPSDIVIPYTEKTASLDSLIDAVFPNLHLYSIKPENYTNRCILSPKNSCVDDINNILIEKFPGDLVVYTSSDQTIDLKHQGDYEDFLNSLNPSSLPPHKLLLKRNCPVILLRNLNPTEGLCNGTRLICVELTVNTICAKIASGQHAGKMFFIPKIPLHSSDKEKNGIPFKRTQFPVRLSFAMTINKAQGQTLNYVGIYLRELVFSHSQSYVVLSKVRSSKLVKVLILPPTFNETKTACNSRNVVFSEISELANT